MDLFEKYLEQKESNNLVKRALTDRSYKNEYQRNNHKEYKDMINEDLLKETIA